MGNNENDSDSDGSVQGKTIHTSPSIDEYAKDMSNLCANLTSQTATFLVDKRHDSDASLRKEMEEAIKVLGHDETILKSLNKSLLKLRNKQKEIEDKKEKKKDGRRDTSPASVLKPPVKRKNMMIKSPTSSKLKSIEDMIPALAKFAILLEKKIEYLTIVEGIDLEKMNQQEKLVSSFIDSLDEAREDLQTIVKRMHEAASSATTQTVGSNAT